MAGCSTACRLVRISLTLPWVFSSKAMRVRHLRGSVPQRVSKNNCRWTWSQGRMDGKRFQGRPVRLVPSRHRWRDGPISSCMLVGRESRRPGSDAAPVGGRQDNGANGGRSPWARSAAAVPRFVSLKSDKVNVRRGAGQRPGRGVDRISRAGLPVEITAEWDNWRRIRDADGAEGWVFHSLLVRPPHGARRALGEGADAASAPQRRRRRVVVAQLQPQVLASVSAMHRHLVPDLGRWLRRLDRTGTPVRRLSWRRVQLATSRPFPSPAKRERSATRRARRAAGEGNARRSEA